MRTTREQVDRVFRKYGLRLVLVWGGGRGRCVRTRGNASAGISEGAQRSANESLSSSWIVVGGGGIVNVGVRSSLLMSEL